MKSLSQIVTEHPFAEYGDWWQMGSDFLTFMSHAILSQWAALPGQIDNPSQVQPLVAEYVQLVFGREASPTLAQRFGRQEFSQTIYSGEFDALSYAYFRSAFECLGRQFAGDTPTLAREKRSFTKRVGKIFFAAVHDHLQLDLPSDLKTVPQFLRLQENIRRLGRFLRQQGYLRDNFAFTFEVKVTHGGKKIWQEKAGFLPSLHRNGLAYALYEMGYPVILPSAVYLYHTLGEAQHHSSRTIEELFHRVGYEARETADFDPTGFPLDKVVELWEIRPLKHQ